MRFKCVSKSFKTVITSRYFFQLYLRHHSDTSDFLILPEDNRVICYDIESSTAPTTFTWDDSPRATVAGSACGLLCILSYSSARYLSILNPTTRMHLDINYSSVREIGNNLGFAFHPLNLDFKIVGISDKHSPIKTRTTRVYSLNTRSMIELEMTFPDDTIGERYDGGGVLINKHLLHWKFWKSSLRKWRIGCFDVCMNSWVDPTLYYDPTLKNFLLDIGVLGECLFSSFENRVESCYDVWVMKEYGVHDSWAKVFSIPVSDDLQPGVVPVAYRGGSGEILIRQRRSSRMFWYNRMDGKMTEARFDGAPNFLRLEVICTCSKSQVDIPGGKLYQNFMGVPGVV